MVTSPKAVESWGAVTDPRTPNTSAHVLSAVKESRVQSSTGWNNASLTHTEKSQSNVSHSRGLCGLCTSW